MEDKVFCFLTEELSGIERDEMLFVRAFFYFLGKSAPDECFLSAWMLSSRVGLKERGKMLP